MERYEDSFLQAGFNTAEQLAQITTQSVPISCFDLKTIKYLFFFFAQNFALLQKHNKKLFKNNKSATSSPIASVRKIQGNT